MAHKKPEFTPYQKTLHELSERIVEAQKPIRVLNALKWTPDIKEHFFHKKCKELPPITEAYYQKIPLLFDSDNKIEEFYDIERDIKRLLGQYSGIGNTMLRMCREYREVVRMLNARGTAEFPKISQELYGCSNDAFYAGAPTLDDLAKLVTETLEKVSEKPDALDEKIYSSEEAVVILTKRLEHYFHDKEHQVNVKLSDEIIADCAAGADVIKLRRNARFSERELRIYEIHEGWVHIGTTLNGMSQPICTFLSKGPPSSTVTQEGLALIMEIFTFSSYPSRVRRLTDRVTAIHMAEEGGADFIDVFNFYRNGGVSEEESYNSATRAFRGCLPDKGAFTKDLSYSKGFIMIYNYIRLAIRDGLQSYIPLLFLGKTTLEDLHVLSALVDEGIIVPPKYLPPQFKDLAALTAWMCYSLFLNRLSLEKLTADYRGILTSK
jgi:uncharacterized protein (TIGR02421 family)